LATTPQDTFAAAGTFHPSRGTYRFVVLLIAQ